MSKTVEIRSPDGTTVDIGVWCEGCSKLHFVRVRGRRAWAYNGDPQRPTFRPSVVVAGPQPDRRCHFFVRHGRIEYCADCHHRLAGRTVDMIDVPDNRY